MCYTVGCRVNHWSADSEDTRRTVAGVAADTGTQTSKFVFGCGYSHSLHECRVTGCGTESLTVGDSGD